MILNEVSSAFLSELAFNQNISFEPISNFRNYSKQLRVH